MTVTAVNKSMDETVAATLAWSGGPSPELGCDLILRMLHHPECLQTLSIEEWGRLIPIAKVLGLWPRICVLVRDQKLETNVPEPVHQHLQSAITAADANEAVIRWEITRLQEALAEVSDPVVVLKGAAFLLLGFQFARGRQFGDVDILVPESGLAAVETALRRRGWVSNEKRPLDRLYYRRWLHEIAPMWHVNRQVPLDVHFSIIRSKDRVSFDPRPLFFDAVSIAESPLKVLHPTDMFLHATANLFRTGEFDHLLRDLWDLRELVVHLEREPGFWDRTVNRAVSLNLRRECFLAVRYLNVICGLAAPETVKNATSGWGPSSLSLSFYDALVRRCLFPQTLSRIDHGRNLALTIREWWPPPRLRTVFSYLFWRKRLPTFPFDGGPHKPHADPDDELRRRNLPY
ncbi:nucleotidyltransferase family protein [Planctellipticum variicoloris]|uniref:nucleotidyltransferase domain-containing protein n=1 Tax=Planctellipticum variicoloris TaxID=3064265 RepID=UPI003013A797|nr:nucleotidyltransferase family protein [Planctomycetaceae bacterium SH412]